MDYPENAAHELTMLYLANQDLKSKSVDELVAIYKTKYSEFVKHFETAHDPKFGAQT